MSLTTYQRTMKRKLVDWRQVKRKYQQIGQRGKKVEIIKGTVIDQKDGVRKSNIHVNEAQNKKRRQNKTKAIFNEIIIRI